MLIACLQSEIDTGESSRYVRKTKSANLLQFVWNGCLLMWGAYFCMGAYKHDVVVVIKMGAYIHGVLILCGCLLSLFYGTYSPRRILVSTGSCNSMYLDEVLMDLMDLDLSEAIELQSLYIQHQNIKVIQNSTMDA